MNNNFKGFNDNDKGDPYNTVLNVDLGGLSAALLITVCNHAIHRQKTVVITVLIEITTRITIITIITIITSNIVTATVINTTTSVYSMITIAIS